MARPRLVTVLALALTAAAASGPAAHAQVYTPDTPKAGALYANGQNGRYLMGGQWLFRLDPRARASARRGSARPPRPAGRSRVSRTPGTPTDESEASMHGGVGWYRKDFKLPSSAKQLSWVIRFESVNYRSRVWLNGKPIGSNTGAYLPFEVASRPRRSSAAASTGSSSASTRARTRRRLPAVGRQRRRQRRSAAGGTTAASCARSTCGGSTALDFSPVQVRPVLPCSTCAATIRFRATRAQLRLAGAAGPRHGQLRRPARQPRHADPARGATARRSPAPCASPSPQPVVARQPDALPGHAHRRRDATRATRCSTGIRSIRVVRRAAAAQRPPLNFRGVGLHEDSPSSGFAIDNADPRPVSSPGSRSWARR